MLAAESDERLVALARAGDERAFAAIIERYRAPLLRYVRGYLPPAAADDALQQTLINAYSALVRGTAEAPVALRPWLYRVAHNVAGRPLDVRRSGRESGDVLHTAADVTLAREELGFAPVTRLADGLEAELEWVIARERAELSLASSG